MDKYRKQEKALMLLCAAVALVMLLSWARRLFA